jgi:hypothetical protein
MSGASGIGFNVTGLGLTVGAALGIIAAALGFGSLALTLVLGAALGLVAGSMVDNRRC